MKSEHLTEVKQILKQHQFKKLFSGDTENTFIQFFRYCFVGGFATVVDWALSSLLFYLAFSGSGYAALCNGLSFVAGLLVNYFLSTFWIFKQSKMQNRFLEFLSFAAIGVVGLLLTIGITKGFAWALADVTSLYQRQFPQQWHSSGTSSQESTCCIQRKKHKNLYFLKLTERKV